MKCKTVTGIMLALSCAISGIVDAATTVLTADHMLDVRSGKLLKQRYIVIQDERITAITADKSTLPKDAKLIDLGDKYLIPGLMDMHTHLMGTLDNNFYAPLFQSPHRAVIGGVVNAQKTLMAGFTVVRDVGASDFQDVALRNAINAGEVPGPRMAVSGPALGITGGHCDDNVLNHSFEQKGDGVADGPWAVRQMVRRNVKYGVDLIKFCATGGVFSKGTVVGQRQYTLEEMKAIVDEAHTHGRIVAAHAHGTEGIRFAIEAGVDSIEHASFLDKETIAMAKAKGTALSMDIYNTEYTLAEGAANGVPEENLNKEREVGTIQRQSFSKAVKAGAFVVLGSDAGVYPHGDNGKQLARMVKFGMTPIQALQASTIKPAELLNWQADVGEIKPGLYADIIAVDSNPLSDISTVENVSFVMKGGVVYKQ
ncbi:amidohydrolase family protein [Corallincola luteus]|uniref:Amidohydrolase family protein n=2 Tax=Corallincola TaxID=1775176 RepID=A0A368N539_9GAMM|nr:MULTISPECIES: amidohydrolase family protein [Corallincola]RCU45336.1 amidohydrolase family protein [Corallincola holothuriorum]TCI01270.1 amidohydrolase family protein [Corallincola luteus]